MRRGPGADPRAGARSWRSTARCTPTPRLVEAIRDRAVPDSRLSGTANLLIMPTLDAANIAFNLLKAAADGLPVGPMLLGMSKPIHVLVPSVTARGIVNLSALAVAGGAGGAGGAQWIAIAAGSAAS